MSAENIEASPQARVGGKLPVSVSVSVAEGSATPSNTERSDLAPAARTDAAGHEANATSGDDKKSQATADAVSPDKVKMRQRLPALADDADVGVEKEYIVTRDGKADLLFTGVLLASAAPTSAPKGQWQEYRIYRTNGDKHVFSKVTRDVRENEDDAYEAEVFDPAPSSVPSQLMRSAREIARNRPLTWMDAAVTFFGYDPLAKALYRKLSVGFEEKIS